MNTVVSHLLRISLEHDDVRIQFGHRFSFSRLLKSLYQSVKFLIAHLVLESVFFGTYHFSNTVNSAPVFSLNRRRLLNDNDKRRFFVGLSLNPRFFQPFSIFFLNDTLYTAQN